MKKIYTILFILLVIFSYSQNGLYMEYSTFVKEGSNRGVLKLYSSKGSTLSVDSAMDGSTTKHLRLSKKPDMDHFIMENGEYITIPDNQLNKYKVTILGNEKMNGYDCVKIAVERYNDGNKTTLWITDKIPGYENYLSVMIGGWDLVKLNTALKKSNLGGIPVRIGEPDGKYMIYDFIKMEPMPLSESIFQLEKDKKAVGRTLEQLRKDGEITEEEYKQRKAEEKEFFEQQKKKDK